MENVKIESHYNHQLSLIAALEKKNDTDSCSLHDWNKHVAFVEKCLFTPIPVRLISLESNQGWLLHWCCVVLSLCDKYDESHINL